MPRIDRLLRPAPSARQVAPNTAPEMPSSTGLIACGFLAMIACSAIYLAINGMN